MSPAAPDFFTEQLPRLRMVEDAANDGADFGNEIVTKSGNLALIISRRIPQLLSGRRQQAKCHRPSSVSME